MRVCSVVFLMFLSVSAALCQNGSGPGEKEILPILEQQMTAANAHDADRFLAPFVHSDDVILVANGEIIRGWDHMRDQQLKWWDNGKADVVYAQTAPPEFAPLDAHSMVVTQQLQARRGSSDANGKTMHFVVTTIWKNSAGGWKIVYSHESFAM